MKEEELSLHTITGEASCRLVRKDGEAVVCSSNGMTRGVTASLACHQCYSAGSSLVWGLNLRAF